MKRTFFFAISNVIGKFLFGCSTLHLSKIVMRWFSFFSLPLWGKIWMTSIQVWNKGGQVSKEKKRSINFTAFSWINLPKGKKYKVVSLNCKLTFCYSLDWFFALKVNAVVLNRGTEAPLDAIWSSKGAIQFMNVTCMY